MAYCCRFYNNRAQFFPRPSVPEAIIYRRKHHVSRAPSLTRRPAYNPLPIIFCCFSPKTMHYAKYSITFQPIPLHLSPQDQNDELSHKLAARPAMPAGLERTLLESHLRLLLGKLGVETRGNSRNGNAATTGARGKGGGGCGGAELGTAGRPPPHTFRDDELGRSFDRACCASATRRVVLCWLLTHTWYTSCYLTKTTLQVENESIRNRENVFGCTVIAMRQKFAVKRL